MSNTGLNSLEKAVIDEGLSKLTKAEIENRLQDTTVWGDYYTGRIFVTYFNKNGTMHGKNDLGSYVTGKWRVSDDGVFTVAWDGYWDNWSSRVYEVNGKLYFYEVNSSECRCAFNNFAAGECELELL